jgi:hypothetical protein
MALDGAAAPRLRARTAAWRRANSLLVVDEDGARSLDADWSVERHELSADGQFILALGDDSKRAQIWETKSGRRVLTLAGDLERRQSLLVDIGAIDAEPYAFVYVRKRPKSLSLVALADGRERAWLSTSGMIALLVDRVISLEPRWLAVRGHGDGEGYDTIVAIPARESLSDTQVLQTALLDHPRIKEWGYRVAVGPAGAGQVVIFRDPEWDDADGPPDDPHEAFAGFLVFDLASTLVVERIAYGGKVPDGATIGADRSCIAVETGDGVDVITRATGNRESVDALALDPYRLELLRRDGDALVIARL